MLRGLILKESLEDLYALDLVHITRTETWEVSNAAGNQPTLWTALSFEAEESQAGLIARKLSQALKAQGWYTHASTSTHVFIIFPGKVFKDLKGDLTSREAAKQYGRGIGIPESQLDWRE